MADIPLIDPPIEAMTLRDGRCLTWQEFGLPHGKPVLYFHGGGSISFEAGIFHREAVQQNIRLIATNRPGTGGSSVCRGRPVAAYSDDLNELLDRLGIERFACFGESNGGMVSLAVAATLSSRVLGAVPINPTLPWFDPLARSVSSRTAAVGYRLLNYLPWVLAGMAARSGGWIHKQKSKAVRNDSGFDPLDLAGPPPGTEQDIAEIHWRTMEQTRSKALMSELRWAAADWGFDYYAVPVPLDFFCGVHDSQAPFALILADRNVDARFHSFSFGHHGFSHPNARRRIINTISGYFEA